MKVRRRKHLNKLQLQWINPPQDRPWTKQFVDVLECEAWKGLTVNARRIHDVLTCWYVHNHQQGNGEIKISFQQFEAAGIPRNFIASGVRELGDTGFIATKRGEHAPGRNVLNSKQNDTRPILYRLHVYDKAESDGIQKTARRHFAFITIEVMESREWREMSINARRVIELLLIANKRLCYEKNGELRVSVREFEQHGVNRRFVSGAIKELVAAGLLAKKPGKRRGLKSAPFFYRLTFLGTIDGPATWKPAETQGEVGAGPNIQKRKAKLMQTKIFSPPPKCTTVPPPKCTTADPYLPPPKCTTADSDSPPPKCTTFMISSSGMAETAPLNGQTAPTPEISESSPHLAICPELAAAKPKRRSNGAADPGRADRLIAYAMTHRGWIERFGLPSKDEADALRTCYRIGDTTADEWLLIQAHMCPIGGKPPQASYTAILRGIDAWVIVDGDRDEVPITRTNRKGKLVDSFESRMDAWHYIDKLRYAAGCVSVGSETSPEVLSMPTWRGAEARRMRGH